VTFEQASRTEPFSAEPLARQSGMFGRSPNMAHQGSRARCANWLAAVASIQRPMAIEARRGLRAIRKLDFDCPRNSLVNNRHT
jgi:hypothetical protein